MLSQVFLKVNLIDTWRRLSLWTGMKKEGSIRQNAAHLLLTSSKLDATDGLASPRTYSPTWSKAQSC